MDSVKKEDVALLLSQPQDLIHAFLTLPARYPMLAAWFTSVVRFVFPVLALGILAGAIRGCGEALPPMLLVAGGVCVLRLVWIFSVLPFRRELSTVLISYPLSWAATSVLFVAYYLRGGWLKRCIRKSGGVKEAGGGETQ